MTSTEFLVKILIVKIQSGTASTIDHKNYLIAKNALRAENNK